ncbi:MAG: hypothetical protein IID37_02830 [Planctomycetes bacterium]|nr:hypothetical protein [Planctomycetota bacterium]
MHNRVVRTTAAVGLLLGAGMRANAGDATAQFVVVDETGQRIGQVAADGSEASAHAQGSQSLGAPRNGDLWVYTHATSIPASVSVGAVDTSWAGVELNVERLLTFDTFGDGTPAWEASYEEFNPPFVGVAASEQSDFALAVTSVGDPSTIQVQAFDSTSPAALWTYTFDSPYTSAGSRTIDVSRDGSTAVAVASDFGALVSRLVVFNQLDGSEAAVYDYDFTVSAVYLSMDGSRAMLTAGATARLIDVPTGVEIASATASGTGGTHRMSADGSTFGVGGFNLLLYREIDGVFEQVYSESESTQWYGNAIAFSSDGHYAIAASYNYLDYATLTYRIIDVEAGAELARTITQGIGGYQDVLTGAAVNDDGTVFGVSTWGLIANEHPEVMFFDRDAEMIGSIDTPGSVFAMDMSSDGHIALSGSKSVHANVFGNGGDVPAYEVFVPPPPCDGDANGDSLVDPLDTGFVLARFGCDVGTGDPDCDIADMNGDGLVDPLDVGYVLARFGTCE